VITYSFQAGLDGLAQEITAPGYPLVRLTDTDIAGDNFGGQTLDHQCENPEVQNVVAEPAALTTISWDDEGFGVVYDVVGGSLVSLRTARHADAAQCRRNDLQIPSYNDETADPPPDDAQYYLIRYESDCGTGTYGFASSDEERLPTSDCF